MREIEAELDWNVPPGLPAGSFTVVSLTDDSGADLRPLVADHRPFPNLDALRQHLCEKLKEEVLVIEANSIR